MAVGARLGRLDLNSTCCYLLLCKHFLETCTVAVANGEIVGFVTAYPIKIGYELFFCRTHGTLAAIPDQTELCAVVPFLKSPASPSDTYYV